MSDQFINSAKRALDQLAELIQRKNLDNAGTIALRLDRLGVGARGWVRLNVDGDVAQNHTLTISNVLRLATERSPCSLEYEVDLGEERIAVIPDSVLPQFVADMPDRAVSNRFSHDKHSLRSIQLRALLLSESEAGSMLRVFGRSPSVRNLTANSKGKMLRLIKSKNEYTEEEGPILQLGEGVDYFHWREYFFVLNKDAFMKSAKYDDVIKRRAYQAAQKIFKAPNLKISNFEEFEAKINTNSRFRQKLAAADAAGCFDEFHEKEMAKIIEERSLDIKYTYEKGVLVLEPELTAKALKDVVELLADDHVMGHTGKLWYAPKKEPFEN